MVVNHLASDARDQLKIAFHQGKGKVIRSETIAALHLTS